MARIRALRWSAVAGAVAGLAARRRRRADGAGVGVGDAGGAGLVAARRHARRRARDAPNASFTRRSGARPRFAARRARHRRPVLPARGQRRLRHAALRPDVLAMTRRRTGSKGSRSSPPRPRRTCRVRPRPAAARRRQRHRRPAPARFARDGQELQITPAKGIREGRTFVIDRPLRRRPADDRRLADRVRLALRLPAHRRRRVPWATSPTSPRPGSRSPTIRRTRRRYTFRVSVPKGLGVVANGTLKYHLDIGEHVALGLGRTAADGVLPRDRRHRPLDRAPGPHARRDPGVRRRRPGAAGRHATSA